MPTQTLHERIAETLGWTVEQVQSFSLQSVRELVRPVNPTLASEITSQIESGSYIVGRKLRRRSR